MKRTLSFMVMALALLLTQCRKPEVKFPSPVAPEGTTVSMTVTAGPGSKTDITAEGKIKWSKGDKLYVSHNNAYVGCLELVGNGGSATGTFSGTLTLDDGVTGEQPFRFFYLGSTARTLTVGAETVTVSFATQTGLREDLGSCHVGYGTANGTVTGNNVTDINVTLVSKVALARFSFKKRGTSEGYSGALTLSGDRIYNSMKVNFGGTFTGEKNDGGKINLTNTTTSEKYVMLVPAGATAATLEFDAGAGTTDCNLANGIEANKYYGQGGAIEVMVKVPVPVESVTLNKPTLSLEVGDSETLTATVLPDEATNKEVTWESDDTGVATVDGTGKVTAVAAGGATITVTTADGSKTATCAVTVTAPAPYVDLGLPSGLLWATCNLGAEHPYDYGDYYAWGEILPYYADGHSQDVECTHWREDMTTGAGNTDITNGYHWKTYSKGGSNYFVEWTIKPYGSDKILTSARDVATQNLGSGWRMPTEADFNELINYTDRSWTTENGVAGWKCANKSDPTKYIFFPAGGYRGGTGISAALAPSGYYWSSTYGSGMNAKRLWCYSTGIDLSGFPRASGCAVRPVFKPQN